MKNKARETNGQRPKCEFVLFLLLLPLAVSAAAQPRVGEAETARLLFQVSAVPRQGEVAEQVRQCLKGFQAPVVKLRAFIVGQENAARVRAAIEAEYKKRRQPLPVLSLIVIGALPEADARVVLEAVSMARQTVNPNGIAFISGQPASTEQPVTQVAPLVAKSLAALRTAHQAIEVEPPDVLCATCFVSALADVAAARQMARREFPQAALNFVQLQRLAQRGLVECETIVRLRARLSDGLQFTNPAGLTASANYSHIALIGARRVVFSEMIVAAGGQEVAARAAFAQLQQALLAAGSSIKHVALSRLYPISQAGSDLVRKVRFDFYDQARPPASTLLIFEGLPTAQASFAVAVVAVKAE